LKALAAAMWPGFFVEWEGLKVMIGKWKLEIGDWGAGGVGDFVFKILASPAFC